MSGPVDVLAKVATVPETGCWLWLGYTNERGYGRVYAAGRMWLAHRLSWTQAKGDIPAGTFICHKCDTPSCVNPDHLFSGAAADNNADMASKGRHWRTKAINCVQGHSLSGANLTVNNRGDRVCLECKRKTAREWKRANKEARHEH